MKGESDCHDTSAMVTQQLSNQNWQDRSKTNHPKAAFNIDKSTLKCTCCNKISHIKSRYFELVGYPELWDHNREQRKKDSKNQTRGVH